VIAASTATVRPSADGTLVDGGVYGVFDGVADNMDWTFNQSSYEGAITLSTPSAGARSEYRVVWEYNLSTVALSSPVSATLNVSLRGATVFPLPDAEVEVYAYPADLKETSIDFSSSPSQLAGTLVVHPFQPATAYALDVSNAVSAAISSGAKKVAFRFQIKPKAQQTSNQAFIDATDSDVASKPYLKLGAPAAPLPGDYDNDLDADDNDYAVFEACSTGPATSYSAGALPAGCSLTPDGQGLIAADFDRDQDVDQTDFAVFQRCYRGAGVQVDPACAN
jgi:hypothetical protein